MYNVQSTNEDIKVITEAFNEENHPPEFDEVAQFQVVEVATMAGHFFDFPLKPATSNLEAYLQLLIIKPAEVKRAMELNLLWMHTKIHDFVKTGATKKGGVRPRLVKFVKIAIYEIPPSGLCRTALLLLVTNFTLRSGDLSPWTELVDGLLDKRFGCLKATWTILDWICSAYLLSAVPDVNLGNLELRTIGRESVFELVESLRYRRFLNFVKLLDFPAVRKFLGKGFLKDEIHTI